MSEEKLLAEMERLKQIVGKPGATLEDKKRLIEAIHRVLEARGDEYSVHLYGASSHHPAIVACATAFNATYFEAMRNRTPQPDARRLGQAAWLSALPPLVGGQGIADFIACVGFGMAIEIITPEKGSRLLYAAQVAQSNQRSMDQKATRKPEERRRGPYNQQPVAVPPDAPSEISATIIES